MKAKYINPYTDFGFKKLFGEEASKGSNTAIRGQVNYFLLFTTSIPFT